MRLPEQANPCCGYLSSAATDVPSLDDSIAPKDNDLAVCAGCGATLIFVDAAANIKRIATPKDLEGLPEDELGVLVLAAGYFKDRALNGGRAL